MILALIRLFLGRIKRSDTASCCSSWIPYARGHAMLGPEDAMPSRIRDHHVALSGPRRGRWFAIAAAVLFVLPIVTGTATQQKDLTGTFTFVKDSDGITAKAKATVTLTFRSGVVSVSAVQPGETVEDTGTYVVAGNLITIAFNQSQLTSGYGFQLLPILKKGRVASQAYAFPPCRHSLGSKYVAI